ncbi:N-acetylmuramoyl-L-alanine amidase [Zongyangia hominis]|uniref:N-acetylmuramoyl-L-alanine amidase n=1 Tax=Zongyangia hominis TaxID=2763677 RepID=A0A926IAP4_9FIRM|nr:N-acetylmuramoyl-L-alanine amidase [Zongyangia hominis]MBC8569312.1 N-acetylmuramoyl-L-alanine amidase [Zongyangia hominis]
MPIIYLSPSTQEWNPYVTGGTEEYYMNLVADAMEPYLRANGIAFSRNTPDMTAASSIKASNAGNYDLHLALHSNAAPPATAGTIRGTEVYYAPGSVKGQRAAEIIANNLKTIYPLPDRVRALPTTTLGEVTKTRAPAVLIEFAYHDNVEDANWIKNNIGAIARNVVLSLTEYFGLPFITPGPVRQGTVSVGRGSLNIRSRPSTDSAVVARAYNGDPITIYGQWQDWYSVNFNGVTGFANAAYVDV